MSRKIASLRKENQKIKRKKLCRTAKSSETFSVRNIRTDAKMNFYTGITTIQAFHALYGLILPYLPQTRYWRGPKNHKNVYSTKIRRQFDNPLKKLKPKDEFLLTLMRLRLGVLLEDLADRFEISEIMCSNTVKTWVRIIRLTLGKALINWLSKENILQLMPECF